MAHPIDQIRLFISQQEHPFRRGHPLMAMCRLLLEVRILPHDEMASVVADMEAVLWTPRILRCMPCTLKCMAWLVLATDGMLPEQHRRYAEQYHRLSTHLAARGNTRDFMQEMVTALSCPIGQLLN